MAFTVENLLDLGRVQALAIAPSGSYIVVEIARLDPARAKLVPHLYRIELVDGRMSRLTSGEHGCRAPTFRNDGALLFLSTRPIDGEEKSQVWMLPEHGEATALTREPLGVLQYRANGDALVVLTPVLPGVAHEDQAKVARDLEKNGPTALQYKEMPARQWDHWYPRAAPHLVRVSGTRLDLTPNANRELREIMLPHGREFTLSRDGKKIVTEWSVPARDRIFDLKLVEIDVQTGAMNDLHAQERAMLTKPVLSEDGETLVFNRHARSGERYGKVELCAMSMKTRDVKVLASSWDRWATPHAITKDGRVIVTSDDHMQVPVWIVKGEEVTRLTLGGGCHDAIQLHPDGRSIVGLRHTLLHPPEPFQAPIEKPSEPFVVARASGVEPATFVEISSHTTRVSDEEIEWVLVRPKEKKNAPVLFWIHGGPVGQFANGWHWRWCPLVFASAGWAVVLPNPRGSTGRGQAFVEGIWGNVWGDTCYRDLMSVADDVEKRSDVDGKTMIAMGGSFGGYMANYIGGHTDRFRGIVTHASLYHLEQFGQTTDIPAWCELELGAVPPEGRDELDRYSPHRALAHWKTRTLVIHGEKDYRVPIFEALALFEGLQRNGIESELLVFPDEGHWITRPRNIAAWYEAVLSFISTPAKT